MTDDPEPTFISALRELESPVNDDVLNLAATLGTQTDHPDRDGRDDDTDGTYNTIDSFAHLRGDNDDADDDEVERAHLHYLRATQEHDQARLDRSRERLRLLERQRDELEQRDRLRRVMSRLSRLSDNNYGDRVPSQNSLYDWSPASNVAATTAATTTSTTTTESSLRSTAILQSAGVRRHPRFSARTRETATSEAPPRHVAHRSLREMLAARNSLHSETTERDRDRDRDTSARHMSMQRLSEARSSPMLEHTVKYLSRIRHSSTIDESLECARDAGFLSKDYFCLQHADFVADTFTIPTPSETSWLAPGAVLSGCQHATSIAATAANPASSRHPGLPQPIRPWIWNPNEASTSRSPQLPEAPPQQDRWPVKVTIHHVDWDKMSLSATMEAYNVPSHPHSHSILSTNSTWPPVTRTSSITTYLEGEILDFNTHTLLTESFKSNAANDATYWRKLPPFQKMSDDEVIRSLTSKKWLTEVLGQEWILMRWKERCFVKSLNRSTADPVQPPPSTTIPSFPDGPARNNHWTPSSSVHASQLQPSPYRIVRNANTGRAEVEITPQPLFGTNNNNNNTTSTTSDAEQATFDDSGCGLTISGFYYVALDRRSGMLEGLYYDPQSSPYQCLKLESVRGGLRSAWEFR
ncbi:vacuolar import degradation vid24 [Pyrenophora seminiperda CCB06]|uniref:Vacuolar import degradation vid24 n=1 Tax=Pyrenophora seminiperda CCB06 TaxID=1302712 RepID=A0A3M7M646_9PLEO|nr:vacuolar import degradation vid24 [Pyrenophora seminiperda CCB06]